MLKRSFVIGAALIMSTASTASMAQGGFYIGAKTGEVKIDLDEIKDDGGTGWQVGYEFSFGLAIQVESLSASTSHDILFTPRDADMDTTAVYAVYRTPGTGFFMVKGGILNEKVDLDTPWGSESETDTGFSTGIGGGVRLGEHFFAEAEYTLIEQDVSFLGIGASLQF